MSNSVVYITEQGSLIKRAGDRILVTKEKETLLDLPLFKIGKLLLYGSVSMTPSAIEFLLQNGLDVAFLSLNGRLKGRLVSSDSKNIFLRLAQYDRWKNMETRVAIGREILRSKMNSQIKMIENYRKRQSEERDRFDQSRWVIEKSVAQLEKTDTADRLRGLEGVASSAYFAAFGLAMKGDMTFQSRKMHPSPDPVNALLSLTYACLTNEVTSALEAKGFEPFLGFLHGVKYGRKSLGLDMVEEYRHPYGDRFVLNLINLNVLNDMDFEMRESGGAYLKDTSAKIYFERWEQWRRSSEEYGLTVTDQIKRQIDSLEKAIISGVEYKGIWE